MSQFDWNTLMANASADFEPLPPNDYDVQVTSAERTQTQNGKLMFKVKFNVLAGPYANRKIFNNFVVSPENPNAMAFFFRHMAALGLNSDYFKANPTPEQVASDLMNRQCRLKIKQRPYQGSMRNDVEAVMPLNGGVMNVPGAPNIAPAMGAPVPQGVPAFSPAAMQGNMPQIPLAQEPQFVPTAAPQQQPPAAPQFTEQPQTPPQPAFPGPGPVQPQPQQPAQSPPPPEVAPAPGAPAMPAFPQAPQGGPQLPPLPPQF